MLDPAAIRMLWQTVVLKAADPPKNPDLVYLCGQAKDNQLSVLAVARDFENVPIACPGHEGSPGFEGFAAWKQELSQHGVDESRIVPIHGAERTTEGSLVSNTLTEAKGLVEYVRFREIRSVVIIAPRWHIVRCFMTFVQQASAIESLRIHPALGVSLPWHEAAAHSQGSVVGIRADLMAMEMARIFEYHAKGDLCDPEVALAHFG